MDIPITRHNMPLLSFNWDLSIIFNKRAVSKNVNLYIIHNDYAGKNKNARLLSSVIQLQAP